MEDLRRVADRLPHVHTIWATAPHSLGRLYQLLVDDPAIKGNNQEDSVTCFPNLKKLYIDGANFSDGNSEDVSVDEFICMLIQRYELGGEIESLSITCSDIDAEDVMRIMEVVVDVEWDWFGYDEDEADRYFEGEREDGVPS